MDEGYSEADQLLGVSFDLTGMQRYKQEDYSKRRMRTLSKTHLVATACFSLLAIFCGPLRADTKAAAEPMKYIGPGSCAATSCHGSVKPIAGSRILQTEYSTWILKDKHSRAYQALTGDVGERMARILKLGTKAEDSPKCLACHALYTT